MSVGSDGKITFVRVNVDDWITRATKVDPSLAAFHQAANPSDIELAGAQADLLTGISGFKLLAGIVTPTSPTALTLAQVKAAAIVTINGLAETTRLLAGPLTIGQAVEDLATYEEAFRATGVSAVIWITDTLTPSQYPFLVAEQSAQTAVGNVRTLAQTATDVMATHADWSEFFAAVKELRRTAILELTAAANSAAVAAILAAITWPTP